MYLQVHRLSICDEQPPPIILSYTRLLVRVIGSVCLHAAGAGGSRTEGGLAARASALLSSVPKKRSPGELCHGAGHLFGTFCQPGGDI